MKQYGPVHKSQQTFIGHVADNHLCKTGLMLTPNLCTACTMHALLYDLGINNHNRDIGITRTVPPLVSLI